MSVSYGLGRDGTDPALLVTSGLGRADVTADPGAMSATLAGSSTVAANLTTPTTEPEPSGGGSWPLHYFTPKPAPTPHRVGHLAATLTGSSRVFAEATTTDHSPTGFDDLALLLALELV